METETVFDVASIRDLKLKTIELSGRLGQRLTTFAQNGDRRLRNANYPSLVDALYQLTKNVAELAAELAPGAPASLQGTHSVLFAVRVMATNISRWPFVDAFELAELQPIFERAMQLGGTTSRQNGDAIDTWQKLLEHTAHPAPKVLRFPETARPATASRPLLHDWAGTPAFQAEFRQALNSDGLQRLQKWLAGASYSRAMCEHLVAEVLEDALLATASHYGAPEQPIIRLGVEEDAILRIAVQERLPRLDGREAASFASRLVSELKSEAETGFDLEIEGGRVSCRDGELVIEMKTWWVKETL